MSTPVEKIKERLDVVEVLGGYLKLEKAGQNYKARCPFHNEKTPSFSVSPSRQSFYCFGCQAGGDIFSFVEKFEGLDFKGALKVLAEKAGVELGERKPEEEEKFARLTEIMEKSCLFFENNLKAHPEIAKYLESRGVNDSAIKKWRIGFAENEWRDLHDFLLREEYKKEDLLGAGVVKKTPDPSTSSGQAKLYDTFRNRVMFPIFDSSSRVIAFSGRSMSQEPNTPKYLNSPETDLFKKSEVLYGLNFAKKAIRAVDYSVLVEGQLDLVLSHEAGVEQAVASSGTALTLLHLENLKKISNRIILAYDGDEAGTKASLRSLELALSIGMEVKIANLPDGEDPASIAQKSASEWKEILRNAEDGIMWVLGKLKKKNKTGVLLAKSINKELLPLLSLIENEMVKSQYVSLLSKESGIPEKAIIDELLKMKSVAKSLSPKKEVPYFEKSYMSPKEMLAGTVLLEEEAGGKNKENQKRFDKIFGENALLEIVENGNLSKDSLIFEAEKILESGDRDKIINDLFERVEKDIMKERFKDLASSLDKEKDPEKREKLEKELKEISKQI